MPFSKGHPQKVYIDVPLKSIYHIFTELKKDLGFKQGTSPIQAVLLSNLTTVPNYHSNKILYPKYCFRVSLPYILLKHKIVCISMFADECGINDYLFLFIYTDRLHGSKISPNLELTKTFNNFRQQISCWNFKKIRNEIAHFFIIQLLPTNWILYI